MSPPTDENRLATPNLIGPGRFAAPAVAAGGGRGEPPGVAPRPECDAAMFASRTRYADAAYCSANTADAVAGQCHWAGRLALRNRVPSASFGGGGTNKDGATMGKDEVRNADACERTNKAGKEPAPAHTWSNREIADGLFAVLRDFCALEREAFERECEARREPDGRP